MESLTPSCAPRLLSWYGAREALSTAALDLAVTASDPRDSRALRQLRRGGQNSAGPHHCRELVTCNMLSISSPSTPNPNRDHKLTADVGGSGYGQLGMPRLRSASLLRTPATIASGRWQLT